MIALGLVKSDYSVNTGYISKALLAVGRQMVFYSIFCVSARGQRPADPNSKFVIFKMRNNASSRYFVGTTPNRWGTGVPALNKFRNYVNTRQYLNLVLYGVYFKKRGKLRFPPRCKVRLFKNIKQCPIIGIYG